MLMSCGSSASRTIYMTKNTRGGEKQPIGIGLQTTSCGIGILVTEIDKGSAAADCELRVGDCILSVDGSVPSSPKEAVALIVRSPEDVIRFVVIGDQQATMIA